MTARARSISGPGPAINPDEYRAGIERKFAPAVDPADPSYPATATLAARACRVCGCTDDRACDGGCWWVEDDLCSQCQRGEAA